MSAGGSEGDAVSAGSGKGTVGECSGDGTASAALMRVQ